MWLKVPEDLHQKQLQDHQNNPQGRWNRLGRLQQPEERAPYMYGSEAHEADSSGPGSGSSVGPQGP